MTRLKVHLVERRTREVRLPSEDVCFLLAHARHLVEVVPAFRRGVYRLTPRGVVGWFEGPTCRFVVRPKVPWPTVRMLIGLTESATPGGSDPEPDCELLDVLAREFAEQLRAVTAIGLVPGYHDSDTTATFLRGKLRAVDQLRDAAVRAFPDRFHVTESVLDLDTPWNRIPRVIGENLLANDRLPPRTGDDLRESVRSLESLPITPLTDADFAIAEAEPRAAHYRPLLAVCRLLYDGFAAARLPGAGEGAFLIDLSRAFERYLGDTLTAELGRRPGWSVERHRRFPVGPTVLQPDILIRRRTGPPFVLDAKWKVPDTGPDAPDLHQVLAYATVTGAERVGLVYPGRRFARREFSVAGGNIRVSLFRVQVIGTSAECTRSVRRLARCLLR